jgi:hypothetical protein
MRLASWTALMLQELADLPRVRWRAPVLESGSFYFGLETTDAETVRLH